jgi:hypothetical protein
MAASQRVVTSCQALPVWGGERIAEFLLFNVPTFQRPLCRRGGEVRKMGFDPFRFYIAVPREFDG